MTVTGSGQQAAMSGAFSIVRRVRLLVQDPADHPSIAGEAGDNH